MSALDSCPSILRNKIFQKKDVDRTLKGDGYNTFNFLRTKGDSCGWRRVIYLPRLICLFETKSEIERTIETKTNPRNVLEMTTLCLKCLDPDSKTTRRNTFEMEKTISAPRSMENEFFTDSRSCVSIVHPKHGLFSS